MSVTCQIYNVFDTCGLVLEHAASQQVAKECAVVLCAAGHQRLSENMLLPMVCWAVVTTTMATKQQSAFVISAFLAFGVVCKAASIATTQGLLLL